VISDLRGQEPDSASEVPPTFFKEFPHPVVICRRLRIALVLLALASTPTLQLLINPALNPDQNSIWVFGLRARLAFW
jgi:hypothetical protein